MKTQEMVDKTIVFGDCHEDLQRKLQIKTTNFTDGTGDEVWLSDGMMRILLYLEDGQWQLTIWPDDEKEDCVDITLNPTHVRILKGE